MKSCPVCKELSPLDDHLFELSITCDYFSHPDYKRFTNIGEWLKIAALLESVNISSEKYAGVDLIWCRPAAEAYEAERKYYSLYSTALTRFIYASNALEETYRFVSKFYKPTQKEIKSNREPSISKKGLVVFEDIQDNLLPESFHHHCENLNIKFEIYKKEYNPEISVIKEYPISHKCHGLHIVRNLRNFIAHGIIPINLIPDYEGSSEMWHTLHGLLMVATRVTALYIQSFLLKFSHKFSLDSYLSRMDYEYYLERLEGFLEENPKHNVISPPKNAEEIMTRLHLNSAFGYLKIANLA
ncbi:hypothetical protein [Pantoea ananatis]|uniref:hypothetical protein n=1 Tax=Pantoea ananas TaxID=553 RepID=UPI000D7197C4|nr:hypothetical protein [Pantoea ananatis]PWV88025.1 hypothetical protein C7426_105182 [Pantoea ananatis]REC90871.1 hypothetical protein C7423_105182 [Pantoea ananatis]